MLIRAKFRSKCRVCGEAINTGDFIYWEKGIGCNHQKCGDDFNKNVLPKKPKRPLTKEDKAMFFVMLTPLFFGPLHFYYSNSSALIFSVLLPLSVGLYYFGIQPAKFRIRVKGGSRRGTTLDMFGLIIMIGCGISFSCTWIIRKLFNWL